MKYFPAQNKLSQPDVDKTLIAELGLVPDHRCDQGKRHSLVLILSIVLLGLLKGKTSLEACVRFSRLRRRWFKSWFGNLPHGIPDPTTIVRALSVTQPQDVTKAVNRFFDRLIKELENSMSLDGKTIKAIHTCKDQCITHILSLFSHTTKRIVDQEGVIDKENEITASPRLLQRQVLLGTTITADALLTQRQITKAISQAGGDYLFLVKNNHPDLKEILKPTFADPLTKIKIAARSEIRKTRQINTRISLTRSLDFEALKQEGWANLAQVGKLERSGWRCHKGTKTRIKETIFLITSRADLRPREALVLLRQHWGIENQLHWQKDYTFHEDRQRTRNKNAPTILAYLRSLAVSLLRQIYDSITKALDIFTERPRAYKRLLTRLNIV